MAGHRLEKIPHHGLAGGHTAAPGWECPEEVGEILISIVDSEVGDYTLQKYFRERVHGDAHGGELMI